jgi:hypothetical protein
MDCNIVVRKIGYREAEVEQKRFGKASVTLTVTLERDARERYTGRIIDSATRKALSGVAVTVDFGDDEDGSETESNEEGQYTLMVEPGGKLSWSTTAKQDMSVPVRAYSL